MASAVSVTASKDAPSLTGPESSTRGCPPDPTTTSEERSASALVATPIEVGASTTVCGRYVDPSGSVAGRLNTAAPGHAAFRVTATGPLGVAAGPADAAGGCRNGAGSTSS